MANTILIFGDSLSAGYGIEKNSDWPTLLNNRLQTENFNHYTVINASISGETTGGGLSRFAETFKRHQPDIVFLELGANDGLRGESLKQMHHNLDAMITYSINNNARLILAGMRIPPNYGRRYTEAFYQVFQQLKEEHPIEIIPFFLEGLIDNEALIQNDGLHPTAKAQPLLMERVWKIIKPILLPKP